MSLNSLNYYTVLSISIHISFVICWDWNNRCLIKDLQKQSNLSFLKFEDSIHYLNGLVKQQTSTLLFRFLCTFPKNRFSSYQMITYIADLILPLFSVQTSSIFFCVWNVSSFLIFTFTFLSHCSHLIDAPVCLSSKIA